MTSTTGMDFPFTNWDIQIRGIFYFQKLTMSIGFRLKYEPPLSPLQHELRLLSTVATAGAGDKSTFRYDGRTPVLSSRRPRAASKPKRLLWSAEAPESDIDRSNGRLKAQLLLLMFWSEFWRSNKCLRVWTPLWLPPKDEDSSWDPLNEFFLVHEIQR